MLFISTYLELQLECVIHVVHVYYRVHTDRTHDSDCQPVLHLITRDLVMADEQDLQWNAGKMSIASADGIASRGERMSWTFSVEINNADLCNHIKEESHISSGEGVIKVC